MHEQKCVINIFYTKAHSVDFVSEVATEFVYEIYTKFVYEISHYEI